MQAIIPFVYKYEKNSFRLHFIQFFFRFTKKIKIMGITLFILLCIIMLLHFIGDFILQTHKQATNKSKSVKYLTYHVLTYCIPFLLLFTGGIGWNIVWFILILFGTHWITDFFTSKLTSHFFQKKDYHNFFVVVGFDQFIHFVTLLYLTDIFIL